MLDSQLALPLKFKCMTVASKSDLLHAVSYVETLAVQLAKPLTCIKHSETPIERSPSQMLEQVTDETKQSRQRQT